MSMSPPSVRPFKRWATTPLVTLLVVILVSVTVPVSAGQSAPGVPSLSQPVATQVFVTFGSATKITFVPPFHQSESHIAFELASGVTDDAGRGIGAPLTQSIVDHARRLAVADHSGGSQTKRQLLKSAAQGSGNGANPGMSQKDQLLLAGALMAVSGLLVYAYGNSKGCLVNNPLPSLGCHDWKVGGGFINVGGDLIMLAGALSK
jgi:hypothetical protein